MSDGGPPRLALYCGAAVAAAPAEMFQAAAQYGVRLLDLAPRAPDAVIEAARDLVLAHGAAVLLRVPATDPTPYETTRRIVERLGVTRLYACVIEPYPRPRDLHVLTEVVADGLAERAGVAGVSVGSVLKSTGLPPHQLISYHAVHSLPEADGYGGWGGAGARVHGTSAQVCWSPNLAGVVRSRIAQLPPERWAGFTPAQLALGLPLFTPGVTGISVDPEGRRGLQDLIRAARTLNPESHLLRDFVDALGGPTTPSTKDETHG